MTRLTALAALVLAALSLAAPASPQKPAAKAKEPPPDYFPLRVNDWWSYRSTTADGKVSEFTMKVTGSEQATSGTIYLVEIQSAWPIHEWYSKPDGAVMWHRERFPKNQNMEVAFTPTRQYLKNPLAAGATWSWKGSGMMGTPIEETSTVSGPESVTVPAGSFKAMRVDSRVTQGGAQVAKSYWYANWVGLVKSTTESGGVKSTTELVDYSFKKR